MNPAFLPMNPANVLTEAMNSGGERLGGQMFGRHRRVLSAVLLIYILLLDSLDFVSAPGRWWWCFLQMRMFTYIEK